MFAKTCITIGLLATAQALTITHPKATDAWDFSQSNTVEWTSVATDPSNFSIVLVDHSSSSGATTTVIKDLVKTADNKYSFANVVAAPGSKYQIQLASTSTTNTGILALSETFNVTKSGAAASTTTSSGGSSPTQSGASGTPTPSKSPNGAAALSASFGIAGGVVAGLFMLL